MRDLEVQTLKFEGAKIEFNSDQIENDLDNRLKKYDGLVFTEENTSELRSTLAELRKGKNAIDSYRKDTKKKLNEPIKDFEDKCKAINSKFDNVINPLKEQLDQYEEKRKKQKADDVQEVINKVIEEKDLLPEFTRQLIIEDFYLSKSKTLKEIEETIKFKADTLKFMQEKEAQDKKLVESTIDKVNAINNLKLNSNAYIRSLEFNSVEEIIELINSDVNEENERAKAKNKEAEESSKNMIEDVDLSGVTEEKDHPDFDPFSKSKGMKELTYKVTANKKEHEEIMKYLSNYNMEVFE